MGRGEKAKRAFPSLSFSFPTQPARALRSLKLRMACYSLIEEVFKNPLNSGMDSGSNFGQNEGHNCKTCSRSDDGGCRGRFLLPCGLYLSFLC